NDQLSVALTNPDRVRDRRVEGPPRAPPPPLRAPLLQGGGPRGVRAGDPRPRPRRAAAFPPLPAAVLAPLCGRGVRSELRGGDLPPGVAPGRMTLGYIGLDGRHRRTLLRFTPAPGELASDRARFELSLRPREEVMIDLAVACWRGEEGPEPPGFDDAQV